MSDRMVGFQPFIRRPPVPWPDYLRAVALLVLALAFAAMAVVVIAMYAQG